MGKHPYKEANWVKNVPCELCGSKDNKSIYDDGSTWCWTCEKRGTMDGDTVEVVEQKPKKKLNLIPRDQLFYEDLPKRKITEETCRFYNYQKALLEGVKTAVITFQENGVDIAQKTRGLNRDFKWRGKTSLLFGQNKFQPQKNLNYPQPLIITEGEIDCLTVAQVFNFKRPVVSLTKGAGHAVNQIKENLEWVESFPEVILCFDADEAGDKATKKVAQLLSYGKCKIVQLPEKDPNELLMQNRQQDLMQAIYNAKPHKPEGIVTGDEIWEEIIKVHDEVSIPYPFPKLDEMTRGIRCGEIVCITAGTGVGKSQFCREVAYNTILQGHKVAYYALEENTKRSAIGLLALHANEPLHLHSQEERDLDKWENWYKDLDLGNKVVFDKHWGSSSEDSIKDKLRHFVKGYDCKLIILDHISIIVSGDGEGDERRKIDNLMTNLRDFVEDTQCALLLVSHLKRTNGGKGHEEGERVGLNHLRGSQAIAQLSDMCIALERDKQGKDKHLTTVRVLKNRYSGEEGACSILRYTPETGRLFETLEEISFDEEEEDADF